MISRKPDELPGALCALRVARGELNLPSTERPPPPERRPSRRSDVSPPDPRPTGGPHPLALRLACGVGLRVALFVSSPALGFAPAAFGRLGAPLGRLGAPVSLLGASLGLFGSSLGRPGAVFGFLSPSLGFPGAPLGLLGSALGFAPAALCLLGASPGFLGSCLGFLDPPVGVLGAPLGPRSAPLVEGKHGVEEIHVGIRGVLRELACSLSCKPPLSIQLLRRLQSALSLSAKVFDHGIEEVLDLLST